MSTGFKSGFIAIIGRPNVGKSTLMNALIGEKMAIISDKPQTTRNRIQCVLTRPDYQMVFVDTPGIHRPKNKLGEFMYGAALNSIRDMDAVLFVVDGADGIGVGDKYIADIIKDIKVPIVLAVNKIDQGNQNKMEKEAEELKAYGNFQQSILISAAYKTNLDSLEQVLLSYLLEGPKYYPDDMITDQPERLIIGELIREKALELLKEEVPHGIAVDIEMIKERTDKELIDINAVILCEKTSHKGIVIGKGGKMLKSIGSKARVDIERLLGIKVYLELFVKIKDDWRNDPATLKSLGYDSKKSD